MRNSQSPPVDPGAVVPRGAAEAGIVAILVVSMVAWGGTWPAGKLVTGAASLELTVFLRFAVTSAALLLLCLATREKLRVPVRQLGGALAAAVFMAVYNHLFFAGLSWGSASKGGVLVPCLNPLVTFLLSMIVYRRKVRLLEVLGLFLGVVGAVVLLAVWDTTAQELFRSGNLFFLGAALCWGSLTVVSQSTQASMSYVVYSFYVNALCALLNLVLVLPHGFTVEAAQPLAFWGGILYLGLIGTAFATTVYFRASKRLGAHRAGSFVLLVPTFAVLLSWLALGEVPEPTTLLGGALTTAAVYLINRSASGKPPRAAKETRPIREPASP